MKTRFLRYKVHHQSSALSTTRSQLTRSPPTGSRTASSEETPYAM